MLPMIAGVAKLGQGISWPDGSRGIDNLHKLNKTHILNRDQSNCANPDRV